MKVLQFDGVKNQFIMTDNDGNIFFQSYDSIIAMKSFDGKNYLDENFWNYSRTTSKYRNRFFGMTTKEIKAGIEDGSIILTNLN